MDETPETDWPLNDPRWVPYRMGWAAGYLARERDAGDRLGPEALDALMVSRFAALLADLRVRDNGVF